MFVGKTRETKSDNTHNQKKERKLTAQENCNQKKRGREESTVAVVVVDVVVY